MASFLIQKGTEERRKNFSNEISKRHTFIKFDQKYSKSEIQCFSI